MFWLQLFGVLALHQGRVFPQEQVLLGSLVPPKCFFEVTDVWGRERFLRGWGITLQHELLLDGEISGILSPCLPKLQLL